MVPVSFGEAFRFWLKLGFISFGGPTGQIAIMHQELGERPRWISEGRFLHAPNYCMLLPGPEAQQLATYIGWLMHRTCGGIVAGGLLLLPSAFILAVNDDLPRRPEHGRFSWKKFSAFGFAGLALGALVLGSLAAADGWDGTRTQMGWFFTKAALVTFGGAYAVLPYVVQAAVEQYHWLTPPQMIGGLAARETTPR